MTVLIASPPDTTVYYHVAYVWVAVVYGGYLAVLLSRAGHVRSRLRAAMDQVQRGGRAT